MAKKTIEGPMKLLTVEQAHNIASKSREYGPLFTPYLFSEILNGRGAYFQRADKTLCLVLDNEPDVVRG